MKEEVIDLIASILEVDKSNISEKTNLVKDLEIESLDLVDLVAAFEKQYNFKIPDKDIKELQTVRDIINYIESHNV